jgi:dipeptidyl aminopeptidase/acylaminoacyl peptidase
MEKQKTDASETTTRVGGRRFLGAGAMVAALSATITACASSTSATSGSQQTEERARQLEASPQLTFELSDEVKMEPVSYRNRFGITVAAHLYAPKGLEESKKHSAIVIGTPYGGVKEQGAGIYAQTLAERGFVTIAFDESYNGESGGEPRRVSSPDIFVEDFSAGVDFLGTLPFVDRNRIGAIGICGSGAFSLTAAQVDHRIKAVATASMYDMSRVKANKIASLFNEHLK